MQVKTDFIARTQLETAIRQYMEGNDYFSVITLAGAAEVILCKLIPEGEEHSLAKLKRTATEVHKLLYNDEVSDSVYADRADYARNRLKHANPIDQPTISIDPEEEARDMLHRAIDNYWAAYQQLTPAMQQFDSHLREKS